MALPDLLMISIAVPGMWAATYWLLKYTLTSHAATMTRLVAAAISLGPVGWDEAHLVWGIVGLAFLLGYLSFEPVLLYTAYTCPVGKLDNGTPRKQKQELTGLGARLWAAHANANEAFPGFLGGVACCAVLNVPYTTIAPLCLIFITARVSFHVCYAAGIELPRTFSFLVGYGSAALLYIRAVIPTAVPWLK
mmetsp:Transcript_32482/g.69167  ORF Transcript_32482/g.69167 Transcript_32482/m.69167 type:complete len:192 (-) Transcript_32482:190-765(-)